MRTRRTWPTDEQVGSVLIGELNPCFLDIADPTQKSFHHEGIEATPHFLFHYRQGFLDGKS
ncbi:MAG: hypothetical protein GY743_18085 [Planctomycetaceae bacterium]|nr:hypothetical protein [Planctomycetaceae bacterium]